MDYRLETFVEYSPGQQDLAATSQAKKSNIGTESHNPPLETSTRVLFSEADDIVHMYFDVHCAAIIAEALH